MSADVGSASPPLPADVRYVIITRHSARWLDLVLDWYAMLDIRPFVLLDSTSVDGTEAVLRRRNIAFARADAAFPRVESLVRLIPDHVDAEWIARLDDDELPSRALVDWIALRLANLGRDVIGIQRCLVRIGPDGRCEYSRHPRLVARYGAIDTQFRLFRPTQVQYRDDIHTPGFHVPPGSPVAPLRAHIAHFDWLVRTENERRASILAYDRQAPGAGEFVRPFKHWEAGPIADHAFQPLPTGEFDRIARDLAGTAPRDDAPR